MDCVRYEIDKQVGAEGIGKYYLESSSNKKELLTALFESSVIRTLILEITCIKALSELYSCLCGVQQSEKARNKFS